MPADVEEDILEALMGKLGEFGKYQFFQCFLLTFASFTAGVHMLSLVTVAATPDHRCEIPGVDNGSKWNITELSRWIPEGENGELSSCVFVDHATNSTVQCESWVFDDTYYASTRTTEWGLVCGQRWMGAVSQASFMLGVFAGSLALGSMADKYGRKTIFYMSAVMQLVFGVAIALVTEYYIYLLVAFLYGMFGSAGCYNSAFVIIMELVGTSKRTLCGIIFQAVFALGIIAVAVWGYFIPNHMLLQIVYGLHSLLLLGHWWLVDESPRWLWSCGRIRESVAIVAKGVRINGGKAIDKEYFISKGRAKCHELELEGATIGDMFRTPFLRKKTLNLCLCWFANSLAYYGLSLNTGSLVGNPYLILFIMGLVEVPGCILSILLMDRTGRRFLVCSFMIIGSAACLITAGIPAEWSKLSTSIVLIGKFCISSSFGIIFNYSAEIFPTVLRNTGLGVTSMCARVSATLVPLITLLDSLDKRLPMILFATITLVAGLMTMFLPETLNEPMPQTIEDGEHFGLGNTCFTTGCFPKGKNKNRPIKIQKREKENIELL